MAEMGKALEGLRKALGRAAEAVAARRGLPLALAGGIVLFAAWVGERDSAWGFPMLVTGGILIGFGLLGPRLSGALSVRWGEEGAFLELRGAVAPPGRRGATPALPPVVSSAADSNDSSDSDDDAPALPDQLVPPTEIEGTAETIEISVTALRAALDQKSS